MYEQLFESTCEGLQSIVFNAYVQVHQLLFNGLQVIRVCGAVTYSFFLYLVYFLANNCKGYLSCVDCGA